ncbi:GHMP family kinase ATP-binding protein [Nocardia jiangsuensis]|uniref:Threonine kinase n=1 Tax=Nocardia jiangsuensis TaxID=1691563 RepID=A0ABV8DZQ3_9NOCA
MNSTGTAVTNKPLHRIISWREAPPKVAPFGRTGTGAATGHHGELLQGMFPGADGRHHRGLVTLPLVGWESIASFRADAAPGSGQVTVHPQNKAKARRAAELTIERCAARTGTTAVNGHLTIDTALESGLGMGASTCDVVAAIRAVADCYHTRLTPQEVGELSVLAEQASDSIMIEDLAVLFAHREGVVLEYLGAELPPVVVVGCLAGAERTVDTLALRPAEFDAAELARFPVLLAALRRGVLTGDLALIGRVATASARINQRFLEKPELETLIGIAVECGAAGVQIAHSGSVAGVLFDPTRETVRADVERCVEAVVAAGITYTATFDPTVVRAAL